MNATITAPLPNVANATFDVTTGITDAAIAKERRELMEDLRVAVGHIKRSKIEVGRLLVALRDGTPHGMWEPLLGAICNDVDIDRATAYRYMKMYTETQFLPPAVVAACKENNLDLQQTPIRHAVTAAITENPNAAPAEIVEQVQAKRTQQRIAAGLESVPCVCPDCGESLPSRSQLKKHGRKIHNIPDSEISQFLRRAEPSMQTPIEESRWISTNNSCPTGKRGFDSPDDIWQLMRAEGSINETDSIAYIKRCGQCGRCHRDKDQSGHREGDVSNTRHQTWYRPDELNTAEVTVEEPVFAAPAKPAPAQAPERTLEDMLDKLVERIALQPYGYYAAKFKAYPEQYTTDLAIIEGTKLDIWQRIVEIGQAKIAASVPTEHGQKAVAS